MADNQGIEVEKFQLRWKSHMKVLKESTTKLLASGKFTDVTLACEGRSVKCHRFILSALSPHLEQVLQEVPNPDGVIYLGNGIKFTTLKNLISFMYTGQVDVQQSEITDLLNAAEELKVKGLSTNSKSSGLSNGEQEVENDDGNAISSEEVKAGTSTTTPHGSEDVQDEGIQSNDQNITNEDDNNELQTYVDGNVDLENEEGIGNINPEIVTTDSTNIQSGTSEVEVNGSGNLPQRVLGEGKGTRIQLKRNKKATFKVQQATSKVSKSVKSKKTEGKQKRRKQRKLVTKSTHYGELMKQAVDRVLAGDRVSITAEKFGIPVSTLCKYVKKPERMQTSKVYAWVASSS